jgi:hypothetical protein
MIPALMFALLSPLLSTVAQRRSVSGVHMLISFPFVLLLSPAIAWIMYWFSCISSL